MAAMVPRVLAEKRPLATGADAHGMARSAKAPRTDGAGAAGAGDDDDDEAAAMAAMGLPMSFAGGGGGGGGAFDHDNDADEGGSGPALQTEKTCKRCEKSLPQARLLLLLFLVLSLALFSSRSFHVSQRVALGV